MTNMVIDGKQLYSLLKNGYLNIQNNMNVIDELNVFPVPDGDTGKNMTATIEGGVLGTNPDEESVEQLLILLV